MNERKRTANIWNLLTTLASYTALARSVRKQLSYTETIATTKLQAPNFGKEHTE